MSIAACAVCRTDLQIVEGDLEARRLPIVPGHQASRSFPTSSCPRSGGPDRLATPLLERDGPDQAERNHRKRVANLNDPVEDAEHRWGDGDGYTRGKRGQRDQSALRQCRIVEQVGQRDRIQDGNPKTGDCEGRD
ncbi:MAG: alcohol dehydrogenase catalytic domain-containing protein [Acidimicrobiia bacterium]|nr:alcohol dehydrogenase catalytic domain-containing protein [Acidimicrobiia bacterium]